MLFAKRNSPSCDRAREIMSEYGLPDELYEVCEIERRRDCTQIENYFQIICQRDTRSVSMLGSFSLLFSVSPFLFYLCNFLLASLPSLARSRPYPLCCLSPFLCLYRLLPSPSLSLYDCPSLLYPCTLSFSPEVSLYDCLFSLHPLTNPCHLFSSTLSLAI